MRYTPEQQIPRFRPNSWSRVLLEKPPVAQLFRNFPTFYRTRRLINMLTRNRHWSLPWARWFQSIPPPPLYLSDIHFSLLSFFWKNKRRLPPTSVSCQWSLSLWLSYQNPVFMPLRLHACYMPYQSHPPWLHSNYTWRRVQLPLCNFLQPPTISPLFTGSPYAI
jgi:hypothetical protein